MSSVVYDLKFRLLFCEGCGGRQELQLPAGPTPSAGHTSFVEALMAFEVRHSAHTSVWDEDTGRGWDRVIA